MAIKPTEISQQKSIVDLVESELDDLLLNGDLHGSPHEPEYWFIGKFTRMTLAELQLLASRYREAGWEVEINERYIKLRNPSA